jgi:hypothetical protein
MRDVYVIDERLSSASGPWGQYASQLAASRSGMCMIADRVLTMETICDDIVHFAGDQGIGDLHLCGHGRDRGVNRCLQLGADSAGLTVTNAAAFRALRPHWMSPRSRIFVHSCYAASVDAPPRRNETFEAFRDIVIGLRFRVTGDIPDPRRGTRPSGSVALGDAIFQALANHAGVSVRASPDEQFSDRQFRLEGRRVIYPSHDPI